MKKPNPEEYGKHTRRFPFIADVRLLGGNVWEILTEDGEVYHVEAKTLNEAIEEATNRYMKKLESLL